MTPVPCARPSFGEESSRLDEREEECLERNLSSEEFVSKKQAASLSIVKDKSLMSYKEVLEAFQQLTHNCKDFVLFVMACISVPCVDGRGPRLPICVYDFSPALAASDQSILDCVAIVKSSLVQMVLTSRCLSQKESERFAELLSDETTFHRLSEMDPMSWNYSRETVVEPVQSRETCHTIASKLQELGNRVFFPCCGVIVSSPLKFLIFQSKPLAWSPLNYFETETPVAVKTACEQLTATLVTRPTRSKRGNRGSAQSAKPPKRSAKRKAPSASDRGRRKRTREVQETQETREGGEESEGVLSKSLTQPKRMPERPVAIRPRGPLSSRAAAPFGLLRPIPVYAVKVPPENSCEQEDD